MTNMMIGSNRHLLILKEVHCRQQLETDAARAGAVAHTERTRSGNRRAPCTPAELLFGVFLGFLHHLSYFFRLIIREN